MTVFVDDMKAAYKPGHRPGFRYVMSHMLADTDEELHAMAAKIGVARRWFQGDHYDITQTKKALAIKFGARLVTLRQMACMAALKRRGLSMGDPETAVERRSALSKL